MVGEVSHRLYIQGQETPVHFCNFYDIFRVVKKRK